jgi:ribonuclease Y
MINILIGLAIGLIIAFVYFFAKKRIANEKILEANELAKKIINDAKSEAETIRKATILEAKEKWYKEQKRYENEIESRKKELHALEKKYNDRIANFEKRLANLDKKESLLHDFDKRLQKKENELKNKEQKIEALIKEQSEKLEQIAGLTKEQAVNILMDTIKEEARKRAAKDVRDEIEKIKLEANQTATNILATSIQRLSVDYVVESTVSVVTLPDNEMKGRIIGREGRNIRAFENATGIDLIIDDTPEAVVLSGFDPVRREIAKITLEKLISDGRIHPGRIEQVLEKTKKEMDENLIEIGKKACIEMNIHNISPNLFKIIGRLKYRTSYGQNILKHSMETGWISGMIAAELGLDQKIARRAGFLHDIGKAVDHEFDGSHAILGANIAKKNGESKIIVNAIEAHHEEVEPISIYASLVQIADAISGARPGARREMLESYMQRLSKIEEIANSVTGVNKSYAIQAGRELRIMVDPSVVTEDQTVYIASDIASKIEKEVQYPGQIKVVVIRQTRESAIAK